MADTPKLIVFIDPVLLETESTDILVLSRKVNGTFNTALAVASIHPSTTATPRLLSQNFFLWNNKYRIGISQSTQYGPLVG